MAISIQILFLMLIFSVQVDCSGIPSYVSQRVKVLDLTFKNARYLPARGFCHISHLTKIRVGYGIISHIHGDAFKCLTNLTHLEVVSAKIKTLPDSVFESLSNLQELKLNCKYRLVMRSDWLVCFCDK